jgi:hypothetical protein
MRESKMQLDGEIVASWLNGLPYEGRRQMDAETAKLRMLILIDRAKQIHEAYNRGPKQFGDMRMTDALRRSINVLNGRLRQFSAAPSISVDAAGELVLGRSMKRSGRLFVMEANVTYQVLLLLTHGMLDRVRQCICGKYFFATRDISRSCSAKCRHKLYEQSETYKAKRKTYNREIYLLKKSGKVK